MVAQDGGIFAFGNTDFHGSLGADPPPSKVVAVAVIGPAGPPAVEPPGPDTTPPDVTITTPAEGVTRGRW